MRRIAALALCAAALLLSAPRTVSAADAPPLKIGFIFSYTGVNAETGKAVDAAIATALREHGGAVAGRRIEIIKRDDTGIAPEVARRYAQELVVQDHVDFLAGSLLTPNAVAIERVSTAAHVPFLIVNAGTSGILENNPYTVRFGFTNVQVTQPLAQWAVQNGMRRMFAIYQDYGPGAETTALFAKAFAAQGGTLLGQLAVPFSATDFSAYVQRIKDGNPEGVFAFINGGTGIDFLKTAATAGLEKSARVISAVEMVDPNDLPLAGDAAVGTVSSINYLPQHESAMNRAFVRAFKKSYGADREPNYVAVAAYDVINAICRVVAAQNGRPDPNKSMELLKTVAFESPRGPISIDPATRDIVQNIYIRQVVRGAKGALTYREIATIAKVKDTTEKPDP